tara:strand:- start:623 stop:955 length:333 start_codon:yes stop_codon:yes gene_type:complete
MNDPSRTKKKSSTYFDNYDLYSDANPKDTIRIKYKTKSEVKQTINKLENIYKKGNKPHKRISQITNVMTQRLKVIDPKDERYKLSNKYFDFLKQRTKEKDEKKRKKMIFK